jgi:biotin transport system permease protein
MAGKLIPAAPPPFAFTGGASPLRRLPAGLKLIAMIVLSIAAFGSVYGLGAAVLALLAASCCSRIPPHCLLKGSRPAVLLSLCVLLLRTFSPSAPGITTPEIIIGNWYLPDIFIPAVSAEGFIGGILTALRILVSFAAASLLFALTTMRELRHSLSSVEKRITGSIFFSLGISLMLGFIPRFFELWETMNLACEARLCRRGLCRLFIILPLVTERMMEAAADTAQAMENRGLEPQGGLAESNRYSPNSC